MPGVSCKAVAIQNSSEWPCSMCPFPQLRLVGVRTSYIYFSNISWTPWVLDPITNPYLGPSSWLHPVSPWGKAMQHENHFKDFPVSPGHPNRFWPSLLYKLITESLLCLDHYSLKQEMVFNHIWHGLSSHSESNSNLYFACSTFHLLFNAFNSSFQNPAYFLVNSVNFSKSHHLRFSSDRQQITVVVK